MTHSRPGSANRWRAAWATALAGVLCLGTPAAAQDGAGGPRPAGAAWTVSRGGPAADVTLDPADGTLTLAVRDGARTLVEPSPLGVVTEDADLTRGLRLVDRHDRRIAERYTTVVGKERRRTVDMAQSRFALEGAGGARIDLVVRAAADGVAYRYVLPAGSGDVLREASGFVLPGDAPARLSDYSVNYEQPYDGSTAAGASSGQYAYPALFQVGDDHVLLSEADVDGRYPASRLTHTAGSGRYDVALADPAVPVPPDGPLATPWRTVIAGDLATVTESTLVDDLAPPSRIADTSWIRPGAVAWSWLAGFGAAQRSLETQQRFVDYAAAHGWEYSLVDDGWNTTDWMPQLMEYAERRGVGVLLWMHWTDLDTAAERTAQLDKVKKWGAAGLKIDFMDSDSRIRMGWYDEILRETADRELMVNFHGSTLPHGIQRTWPHVMTMEGVHGAEQGDVQADDMATLPYTRNVVGSMDFTPMGFQFGRRNNTEAAELALSVVYESGFQNYAGSVEAYRSRPEVARFLEQVPTVWDESRLVAGSPGEGATFARRNGDRWFVGSVRAGDGGTERVPLTFLGSGPWRVDTVRDGAAGLVRDSRVTDRQDAITVPVLADGGFVAQICRAVPGRDSCDRPVDTVPAGTLSVTPERTDARPGTTVDVAARFVLDEAGPAEDVTLRARTPEGWAVDGADATVDELADGAALDASWRVTVPADPAYGTTEIPVTLTYRDPDAPRGAPPLTVERTVRVFVAREGTVYVSSLPFTAESNGWGPVERDRSNGENGPADGGPLRLGGTTYDKGLGVHARSEVTVALNGAYDRFAAETGIDEEKPDKGSVLFEVLGDGQVLARSGVLGPADEPYAFDVDVSGVGQLTLRVTDGGDGIDSDHADWADARLLEK
ncbi:glycoside hydrolase family 97 catalytic domain-containing protein [Streptomyces sp. 4R-3d]|uniref:glycoside hydrolase family 97 catalytic domain-containing protein n=1 Tax=Streptomyces sp. 4R-3d TaxID=2559605 RepID=UPI001072A1C7|nr:glycoside hydrolase family 97 catalytic domain-containing protein [Streptomyces sp. 4R-3d]TFI26176.1 alpha-glucosidase [Streptomyces sp. 4R-3d]